MTTVVQLPPSSNTAAGNNNGGSSQSSSNTGPIVGGVVGGVVGLSVVALLVWFILRKRRQAKEDEFDGNFDPARVVSGSNRLDLEDEDHGAGAGITPYPFQGPPQMSQQSGQPSLDQQQQHSAANLIGSGPNGGSDSIGVGGYFPYGPSSSSSSPPPQHPQYPNYNVGSSQNGQYGATSWNGHGSPPHQPGPGSDGGYTNSSGPGFSPIGAYFNQIPGGPSVGPSVPPSETGSGSGSGGGSGGGGTESGTGAYGAFGASAARMAKEREAYGAAGSSGRLAVSNAAEGEVPSVPSMPVPMTFPLPQQQQQQHPYYGSSSPPPGSSSASPPPQGEKAELGRNATGTGSGVIVHQDGGRIPDEQRERQEEIPPTYDSLAFGDRR